jgi:hypothetical protein
MKKTKETLSRRMIAGIILFFTTLNTKGIFMFWLAGLFLVSILLWGPTGGLRTEAEMKTANRILREAGENRRIESAVSGWFLPGKGTQAGNWYLLNSNNIAIIFTIPVDGIFFPFLAIFNVENEIETIYPLSRTAERYVKISNPTILDIWATRITAAAQLLNDVRH